MSEIIHKTEPIEHWIVDGKAYRLATESDVGKECYFDDCGFEHAMRDVLLDKLFKFRINNDYPFLGHVAWKYAYIQDDSLLTPPEPTPSPKPIDWTKPVRTKDGRAVRVLCTDGPGDYPVIGLVDGECRCRTWMINGSELTGTVGPCDLKNVPQRIQREYWVNVYPSCIGGFFGIKEEADYGASGGRLACVKITIDCEEGEGL